MLFIQTNKGFTLLEIIVATGIMAILLTVAMVNYRGHERKLNVDSEAQKIISILKQAQMTALTSKEVNNLRPAGYGIYFPNNISYFLFADKNTNYRYDEGEKAENFNLSANMMVNYNKNNIVFILPEAEVYFNGAKGIDEATITFQYTGISYTKSVIIKAETGKIE